MEQYGNNPIESDHGRLKSRLRPMRGLKRLRSARVISAGHAFVQNIRRGDYELSVELDPQQRLPVGCQKSGTYVSSGFTRPVRTR